MSEVSSRTPAPARGRGSGRGARGGFSNRGGRAASRGHATNGDKESPSDAAAASVEEDGEIGQLRKQYGGKTAMIKEMFPDWSEVDILFALYETEGDENLTVTRIAEGSISQWGEVPKQKKDKAKPKTSASTTETTGTSAKSSRGGRGDGARGRGRASERGGRGGGAGRGRVPSHAATNGTRSKENQQLSVPTEDAWGTTTTSTNDDATATVSEAPATKAPPPAAPAPTQPTKTWASMLRQATAPKAPPKPKEAPAPPKQPVEAPEPEPAAPEPTPSAEPEPPVEETAAPAPEVAPAAAPTVIEPEVILPPSKDKLTETNLEQVENVSKPAASGTAASTAADSYDPRQTVASATATPISAVQQQHQKASAAAAAAAAAYAPTSLKATERPARTPSYNRRVLDQEEAVRMPGNREVDRTAVQFGAFNLNDVDDDIDGDREEPETRAQPPAESPVAHPRTSLPPVPQPAPVPEAFPTQKTAPAASSLPPSGPSAQAAQVAQPTTAPQPAQVTTQPPAAAPQQQQQQQQQQYGPFGRPAVPEPSSFGQKPFDAFGQQSSAVDSFQSQPAQSQTAQQQQQQQQPGTAFTSAPTDFSNYYTADAQTRNHYGNYYGQQYGQQQQPQASQPAAADSIPTQPRAFGYNASQNDTLSQYPRYGAVASDLQNSGHSTPNPPGQAQPQQPAAQGTQAQPHGQQALNQQYPFSHPYYNNQYYNAYVNQYQGGYGQAGYGYGKGNMYGQPHQYGMPQGGYDHSSATGSAFGQSSIHRGDSGLNSSIGDYGRTGSAQSGTQGFGNAGFGAGMHHDSFGRGASGYQSQAGQGFGGQASQSVPNASSDDLKPYGDAKGAGPSPSLAGARPGSATNTVPPPQSSQQSVAGGYGAYPGHFQSHGAHNLHGVGNAAGVAGSGYVGAQGGYASTYGGVGYGGHGAQAGGFGHYSGVAGAGAGNQGAGQGAAGQQQRGGWSNNYH